MTKRTVGMMVLGTVALTMPRSAPAQFWQGQMLCASSNLSVCFSVTVVQSPSNTLTLTVFNTGTAGSLFTIGLFSSGWSAGSWNLVSATRNGGPTGNDNLNWSEGTEGLNNELDWGVVKANDANAALAPGESIVFLVTFSPDFNLTEDTGLAWHAGALQMSEKCITGTTGENACSVIPEPISLTLLGTGLLGLGGVGVLRRRRQKGEPLDG